MKIFLGFIVVIIIMLALDLGFGYFGVLKTKTVGKAQENARREVFEHSQAYVEGKRQELSKSRKEYMLATDPAEKKAIQSYIESSCANLDENDIDDKGLVKFLKACRDGKEYTD